MSLDTVTTEEEGNLEYDFISFFQSTSGKFAQVASTDVGLFDLPAMKLISKAPCLSIQLGNESLHFLQQLVAKITSEIKE